MAINQRLIPTKINLDLAPEYFDGKTARFIKNLTPYVSTTNENSGATEGKNSGKQKPLQSNELYVNVPLPEGSLKVGDFSSKETNEVFICIYNSDKQHLIYRINGNSRTVDIVYHGEDLKFKLNPENFIAEGSAWLEVIYLTDPATGNKIRRTFFMYTDAVNYQRQFAVEDSIATDSFNANIYPYFKGTYDKETLIKMGLPTPKSCIKITEVERTTDDYGLINNLLFNTWQFRITDIDVWGRPSEHSIISDIYIPGINDCFSSSPNLSRCLNLHFNAGSPIVDKKQIEFRNCNSTQWYLDSVIDLYEGSSIGSWWLRSRNPKITYNSNNNTIDYTFCRTREKNAIPETETSRLFNPLPKQSVALTKIGEVIALSNNKDGFIPFSQSLKDKITITVEPPKEVAITPSRNIVIYVAIYNGHYHTFQQVHKDGTNGYIFGDTNHDPRKYSQYFTTIQQSGFGGYLLGSGAVAFSTQVYVGDNGAIIDDPEFKGQTLSPIGLTFQKFVFNAVPAGVYVFRLFSHLTDLSLISNYQETSTTVYDRCPFNPVNFSIDVFARQNSKEIIIDVCDKDYDTLNDNKILVIADLAYYRARAQSGYIYETRRNGFSENPMELLNVYNPVAERSGACDHNGFYYIESDQDGRTFSFNFKYKCAPAEYDLGTPGSQGMAFQNLYIDELKKYINNGFNFAWPDYYILPCNRILIMGKVFLDDKNIGVPNVTVVLTRGRTAVTDDNGNYTIIAHDDNNLLYRNDEILLSGSTCNYTAINDTCIRPIKVHITLCSACTERISNVEDFLVNYFSQRGLLSGGSYAIGCTAWDWLGRGTYIQDLEIITIPTITESKTLGASKVLVKINANVLFPKEFEYLTFWITDELTIEAYLSWIVDRAEFIDNTGNINTSAPSQIKIYYSSLNEFNKQNNFNTTTNWQFIAPAADTSTTQLPFQNDVVQFYINGDGIFFPKLITALVKYDSEGQFFLIDYTDDLKDLKQNALIRLVRPKTTVSETQPFFEVCHIVNLKNGVAQDNEFYLNFFDTYYLPRQIPVPTPVTPIPTVTQIATTVGDITTYETPVPAATAIELRVFGFPFEHDSPSNFWGKGCKNIGRINIKNPYETEIFSPNQIALSGKLSATGQLNYFNYFDGAKKVSFNLPNLGGITAALYEMGLVWVLCQYDNFIAGFNDNLARLINGNIQIPSAEDEFGRPERKIGSNYGCQLYDKNTIKKRNGLISFVDGNRGEIVQFNYSSIESYTKGQCDSWFRKKVKIIQAAKGDKYFVGGINPITNEYFITDFSLKKKSYINDLRDVAIPIEVIKNTGTPAIIPPPPPVQNILYGFNGVMAFSARPFSNQDVLNSITTIGKFGIMRYPGGNAANSFNWHTGKDDDGTGAANTLADLKALYDDRGCDILFVLNMLTKTMSDQLTMLATAHALGIPIKYVELGNEFNNVNNPGHITFPTPISYANEADIWKAAIKAVYPSCLVYFIGENRNWHGGENWNDVMLTKNPDGLTLHLSPNLDTFATDGVADLNRLETSILADWVSTGMNLITTVPVCVTETNYTYDANNLLTPESQLATTLFIIEKLTELINGNNENALKMICVRGIEGSKQGALLIDEDAITMQATGFAMQQFLNSISVNKSTKHAATTITEITILNPNETVSFDMITKEMRAFFGFTPEGYSYLDGDLLNVQMFTFKNGQPYSHYNINKNNSYNVFYGVQCERVFRIIFNLAADTKKLMLSVIVNCQNENYFSDQILTDSKQFSRLLLASWDKGDYFYAAAIQCDLNTTYDPNLPDETGQNKLLDGDKLYGEILDIRLVGQPDKIEQYSELLDVIVIAFPQTTNANA